MLLRHLLVRQMAPLRAVSVGLLLDELARPTSGRGAEPALLTDVAAQRLQRLAVPDSSPSAGEDADAQARRFDDVVAQELLVPPPARDGTTVRSGRVLLDLLARRGPGPTPASPADMDVRPLRERLPPGAALLSYVDADGRGALLWVTRDGAHLVPGPDPSTLRLATRTLRDLVADRGAAVADIRAASAVLSALVLKSTPLREPPAVLLVDNGSELAAIPWALLPLPGDDVALIEHGVVGLARIGESCCATPAAIPQRLRILIAPQAAADVTSTLGALPGAAVEPQLIAAALGTSPITLTVETVTDRRAVLDALALRGGWLHIAAHGSTQPKGIVYSGLWLDPVAPDASPTFVSALDVLGHGSAAELLVLSACELGRVSGDGVAPNLNFANAAAGAGARNVVAALWPISDAATALWVPTFYASLLAQPAHDVGLALRAAQLRLRESRTFRHPYYWASIVHVRTL